MTSKHDLVQITLPNGAIFSIAQWKHSAYTTHEVAVLSEDPSTGYFDFVPVAEWSGLQTKDTVERFTDIRALASFIQQATAWASRTVPA